jgi:hypothetical protein
MAKTLKQHKPVGEEYLAAAKTPGASHAFPFPPEMVWNALLDGPAWTEWLPITKVTWTSPKPFSVGTTRTVEIGAEIVEETFFAWEEGRRMAFRFERSTLPVSAAVEDYVVRPTATGCELLWSGKASAVLFLGAVVTSQLTRSLQSGLPKLEALIASQPDRFRQPAGTQT